MAEQEEHLRIDIGKIDLNKIEQDKKLYPDFKYRLDHILIVLVALGWSIFQLWTAGFGVFFAIEQRSIHITFFCTLAYLLYPASKKDKGKMRNPHILFDRLPIVFVAASLFYLLYNLHDFMNRAGAATGTDIIFGLIMLLALLEAARRAIGPALPIISVIFLAYAYFGRYLPYPLDHRGFDIEAIVALNFISTEGMFGVPTGVSATFVYIFIAFGAFLEVTGAGKFFIKLAFSITGRMRGGPAKAAVISSCLMGSVSGSAVANVVTTGAFTIPLMKSTGYSPEHAGAIEASASSGGQLMPPIMGAAAYIMCVYTETSYIRIILAGIIPALLFFFGIFMSLHFHTGKLGINPMVRKDLPKFSEAIKEGGQFILPVVLLMVLLVMDWTPLKAGFYSSMLILILGFFRKNREDRLNVEKILFALQLAARNAISVAAALCCAGVVVGIVTLTGVGLKFAYFIEYLAHGILFLTLFFTMIASLILGMGLPTSACYIVLAILAAPILTRFGLPILASHFFIFYFGILSAITPPVAIAAFAAAGVAKSNQFKTALIGIPLALSGFIIPYWFVYDTSLLFYGPVLKTIITAGFAFLGVMCVSAVTQGFFLSKLKVWERIFLTAIFLTIFYPNLYLGFFGCLLFGGYYWYQKKTHGADYSHHLAPGTYLENE